MVGVCGVLTTVNVGVAVAVAWSRIVLSSHTLNTIGLPEHQEHFTQLQIKYTVYTPTKYILPLLRKSTLGPLYQRCRRQAISRVVINVKYFHLCS